MTLKQLFVQTALTCVAAALGAVFGAFITRWTDKYKQLLSLGADAYVDFLRGVAKLGIVQKDSLRDQESLMEERDEASCDRSSSSFGCACTIPCPKPEDGCSRSSKATSTTTRSQETSRAWGRSETGSLRNGGVLYAAGASDTDSHGHVSSPWLHAGFLNRARFIPFRMHALPPFI